MADLEPGLKLNFLHSLCKVWITSIPIALPLVSSQIFSSIEQYVWNNSLAAFIYISLFIQTCKCQRCGKLRGRNWTDWYLVFFTPNTVTLKNSTFLMAHFSNEHASNMIWFDLYRKIYTWIFNIFLFHKNVKE